MSNRMKKSAPVVLSFSLIGTLASAVPGNVYAAEVNTTKEENVYATLGNDGSVQDIYVVNAYDLSKDTTIVDYGTYTSIKNLSNENEIKQDGNQLTVEASKGKFYYQGDLDSKNLPWNIQIRYYLDGKETKGEELAGKSGALRIQIDLSQNHSVDTTFFENYLLQATIALPAEHCTDIAADGATIANMSGDKQILFNVMGGQEKTLTVSADVTDFEMSAISFKGVPMSFDIDVDELDTSELTDKTSELTEGVHALDEGAEKLQDGTSKLQEGLETYTSGVDSLYSGAAALASGVDTLQDGTTDYTSAVGSLLEGANTLAEKAANLPMLMENMEAAVGTLAGGSAELADQDHGAAAQITTALKEIENGLVKMRAGLAAMDEKAITPMLQGLEALQQIQSEYQSETEMLAGVIQSLKTPSEQAEENAGETQAVDTLNQLYSRMSKNAETLSGIIYGSGDTPGLSTILLTLQSQITGEEGAVKAMDQMIAGVQQLQGNVSGTQGSLQTNLESLNGGLQLLNANIQKLSTAGNQLISGINQLQSGLSTLNQNSNTLISGTSGLQAGVDQLSSGSLLLSENNQTILDGMDGLSEGVGELKDGTEEFADKTSDMDRQILDGLKEGLSNFTGQDYDGISYVSEENVNIDAVQFAMQTEVISAPEEVKAEEIKETQTIWEKLKALFQ